MLSILRIGAAAGLAAVVQAHSLPLTMVAEIPVEGVQTYL